MKGLQPGDAIHCALCGDVHVLEAQDGRSTSIAVRDMLFCHCTQPTNGRYYVGDVGGQSNRGPVVKRGTPKGGR